MALKQCSSRPADQALAYKTFAAMTQPGFLTTVRRAALGLVDTAHLARSETAGIRKLRLPGAQYGTADAMVLHELLAVLAVADAAQLAELAFDVLIHRLETEVPAAGAKAAKRNGGGGGSGGGASSIPSDIIKHTVAVVNSGLSEGAARAIVSFPDPSENAAVLPRRARDRIRKELCHAAQSAAAGMFKGLLLREQLQAQGDPRGWQLAELLYHATRQQGAQLLQVWLYQALHAQPC